MEQGIGVRADWTWRERERASGVVVAEKHFRNLMTNYGLSNIGSALSNAFSAPLWLAVQSSYTLFQAAGTAGDGTISLVADLHQSGDTQLTLGAGQANQETVTFSSVSGSGPYTFTLTGTLAHNHTTADPDWVVRTPVATDTVANLVSEVEYDASDFPTQRMLSPGGYSPGTGQWTVQFFYPGPLLVGYIMNCGLTDNITVGAGNLHNHFTLGVHHTNTANDQEIDGVFTFSNV